jgi:two-component system, OmpR family, sensor histidine kinase MtrB
LDIRRVRADQALAPARSAVEDGGAGSIVTQERVMSGAAGLGARYRSWLVRPRLALLPTWRTTLRQISDRWRRSLQLRVITATMVLSVIVVGVLGYALMQHLVTELYNDKVETSDNIVDYGLATAVGQGDFSAGPNQQSRSAMSGLAQRLASNGETPYALEITLPPAEQGPPVYSAGASVGFYDPTPQLPQTLVKAVRAEKADHRGPLQIWASMAVASSSKPVSGLLVGAPLGSDYQLYYFFPLAAEQRSITSMQRTLLAVGIAVVFLLAAIAWLVTRWVVVPVRLAAQGARRLSTGQLNERMDVRGNDELAALATAFNDMAAGLQEKMAELEDLSQVQRQFVSDVSHELRTPLTTIRIASDVLYASRDEMDAAAGRSAELLQSQLERFESLLTDLLEISRYDANAATLDAEPVDVCTIILQSADVAQQLAERRGTKIEFRLPAEPCIAEVDRRRVERILRNLLLNAVEHGETKDTIVTAATDSATVAISVRDFGCGLASGEEQLVFDRFWRADPARARTSGGTGLGLAIALEDARLHGGWLEAWGEPGKGSVFRLTLPRTVGGELHGSPLPLSPHPADVGAAVLPGVVAEIGLTEISGLEAAIRSGGRSAQAEEHAGLDSNAEQAGARSSGTRSSGARSSGAGHAGGAADDQAAGDARQPPANEVPAHG